MNGWIIENLGWTLLHSLWQIAFVAVVLFSALQILREFSANLRYMISVLALSVSLILPVLTFSYLSGAPSPPPAPQSETIVSKQIHPTQEPAAQIVPENPKIPSVNFTDQKSFLPSINISYLAMLAAFWILGIVIFSIRLIGGIWTVHHFKTRQVFAVEPDWQAKFDEICRNLDITGKVRFLQSKTVEMPMIIGWLKPVVLIPASVFLQVSPNELETILIHELAHIKRYDYPVNFLQSLVEILFFYHPCAWWISAKIRAEREFAVDEFVSQIFETDKISYARALANLEEIRLNETRTKLILAMTGNGGNLMKRIENILHGNRKLNSKNISIWSAIFAITLVIGIAGGVYWLKTGEVKKPKSSRKVAVVYNLAIPRTSPASLAESLKRNNIPALGIVNSVYSNFVTDSKTQEFAKNNAKTINENQRLELVKHFHDVYKEKIRREWSSNGFPTGFTTPKIDSDLMNLGTDYYLSVIEEDLKFTREIAAESGQKLRYFSFSGLSTGKTLEEKQQTEKWLKDNNLQFIPVTLDVDDKMLSALYHRTCLRPDETNLVCQGEDVDGKRKVREKYLKYVNEVFDFYENYSNELFGREIPQVLMLTDSELNADSADELFQMIRDRGYEFVTLEEAISDEAYKSADNFVNTQGISWLQRWGITKGWQWRNEPWFGDGNDYYMDLTGWKGTLQYQKKDIVNQAR